MAKKHSSLIFLAISLILVCFAVSNFLGIKKVKGEGVPNVFGWAWSSNIGWISFNSETDGSIVDYGVHINDEGIFSGYAWSENIGWIHFAPTSGYPGAPQNGVKVDLESGEVSGWARALSFGGGWDGCIKLRSGVD